MKFHPFFARALPPFTGTLFVAVVLWCLGTPTLQAEPLRLQGSPVVAHPISGAAPALRDAGIELKVSTEGGSSAAIAAVGSDLIDIALSTRFLTSEDRAAYPDKQFCEFEIGVQAVAIIVPREVWNAGVRSVTKEQMLQIYEGDITNWKQLGGEDQRIKFYSSERGRGTWEMFALWLYGELRRAPIGKFEIVVGGEDARNTVEFNSGSMSLAAPSWADGKAVCALAIREQDGSLIEPSVPNLVAKRYPLARPAMLVLGNAPTGAKKKLVEFMLSPKGQELVKRSELIPITKLKEP